MSKESGIDTSVAGPSHTATTSSDTETDSSSAGSFIYHAAKKSRKQAFRKAWLEDPEFQSWLEETEDPYKAKCTVCSTLLIPSKHKLQSHASTTIHSTNMQQKARALISGPSHAAATSCVTETDSSSAGSFIYPAAKKSRKQAFRKAWLDDPEFQSWLEETEDPYKVKCTVCSTLLTPSKHKLQNHAGTTIHSTNMQQKARALISVPSHAAATSSDTVKRKVFCKSWLEDAQFKFWLQEVADPYKARCVACCKNIWAGKSELQRHAGSLKHNMNMNHRKEPLHKNRSCTDNVKELEL